LFLFGAQEHLRRVIVRRATQHSKANDFGATGIAEVVGCKYIWTTRVTANASAASWTSQFTSSVNDANNYHRGCTDSFNRMDRRKDNNNFKTGNVTHNLHISRRNRHPRWH
jgi:hypothetical protein